MAKTLDFNSLKKRYLTVKLADEKNTVLMIGTPTKAVLNSFLSMKDNLTADNLGDEAVDELYDIVTRVMNYNKGGIKITKEKVEDMFDYEDLLVFINAYSDFIGEVASSKN